MKWLRRIAFAAAAVAALAAVPLAKSVSTPIDKNNRAVEALDNKRYDEAIALLDEAIATNPGNEVFRRNLVAAYNSKAISLERAGQEQQAADWYEKALALDPNNQTILQNCIATLNNLAVSHSNAREFVQSQPLFERAAALLKRVSDQKVSAEVMRNYAALLTVWGSDLMKTNQTDEARKSFEQALKLDPTNAVASIYLGDIHYEADHYADARRFYTAALSAGGKDNGEYLRNRLAMIDEESKLEGRLKTLVDPAGRFNFGYVAYTNGVTVPELLKMLGEARETIGKKLDIYPARPVNVKVYTAEDFLRVSRLPHWAIGIFDGKMRLRVEDIQSPPNQVRDLLFHEYTHAVLAMNVKQAVPAWFHEGLAQMMEPQFADNPREQAQMRDALAKKPLTFEALKDSFKEIDSKSDAETAYLFSKYFMVSLNRQYGPEKLTAWVKRLTQEEDFAKAFEAVYGLPLAKAQDSWIQAQLKAK